MTSIVSEAGISRYTPLPSGNQASTGEQDAIIAPYDFFRGVEYPPLIFCHGAGANHLAAYDEIEERRTLDALARLGFAVGVAHLGGNTYGNPTGITRVGELLTYLRNRGASDAPPVLVGGSMGAAVALNYAKAGNPVSAIAGVIPLVDVTYAHANNSGGLAAAIDTAYAGVDGTIAAGYVAATHGPKYSPVAYASTLSSSIPIRLFPSVDDNLTPFARAQAFVTARPSTTLQSIGAAGHSGASFAPARDLLVAFVDDPTYPIQPAPPGINKVVNGKFDGTVVDWNPFNLTVTYDPQVNHSGTGGSMKWTATGATQGAYNGYMSTMVGGQYTARLWVRGTGTFAIGLFYGSSWVAVGPTVTLTSAWQQLSLNYTPTAGQTALTIFPVMNSAGTCWIDDVEFFYSGT